MSRYKIKDGISISKILLRMLRDIKVCRKRRKLRRIFHDVANAISILALWPERLDAEHVYVIDQLWKLVTIPVLPELKRLGKLRSGQIKYGNFICLPP